MIASLLIGVLLDDGGRGLVRLLCGVASFVVVALVVAVVAPIALLAQAMTPMSSHGPVSPARGPVTGVGSPVQSPPVGVAVPSLPTSSNGSAAVEVARRYLGVPYVFGGSNPAVGLDCSGLVQLVFRQLGAGLPRTAQLQFNATARVAESALQAGDLVFFARTYADPNDWITHVGIYIGNGLQINAPTEGQVVSIQPVFSGFWGAHYTVRGASGPHDRSRYSRSKGLSMSNPQSIIQLFNTLLDAATRIGLAAAALFLAWAGFLYMTAGGSPRRMESAKDAAFAAIGGLAVVLLAHTIAELIQNAIPGHP